MRTGRMGVVAAFLALAAVLSGCGTGGGNTTGGAQATGCPMCARGKAGEAVWCQGCGAGYVGSEKITCRGCYDARTGVRSSCPDCNR
ncbi:MAG: hypothetical protein HY608_03800 [Planctomycetes bacterium]|nr:hypothetical protein [Planctomycetota bacterium]